MQEHTFQDAGSQRKDAGQHLTHKTQAKIKTTMTYPSRCRISTNPNHEHPSRSRLKEINSPHILRNRLQWLCFGATIAIAHDHHTNEINYIEKLENIFSSTSFPNNGWMQQKLCKKKKKLNC